MLLMGFIIAVSSLREYINSFHREGTHYRFNYTALLLFDLEFCSVVNRKKFNEAFKGFSCLEEGYEMITYTTIYFYA
jgi:hypothetical protein